ncbi:hypothetical protein O1L55_30450 [Streptomyces albulus]|nr:hypothetical protein [Streptomyces noursei]
MVTAGMLRAPPPAEREALFAHERAHLVGRHHLFLLTAALAGPAIRCSAGCAPAGVRPGALGRRVRRRPGGRPAAHRPGHRPCRAGRPDARRGRPATGYGTGRDQRPGAAAGRRAAPPRPAGRPPRGRLLPVGRRLIAAALLACVAFSAAGAVDAAADLHQTVETAQGEQPGR